MTSYIKDPNAVLDYGWDWTNWLASGETISTTTVTATSGITKTTPQIVSGKVSIWLSGGTAGRRYFVSCKITTSAGRTDERSFVIDCQNR